MNNKSVKAIKINELDNIATIFDQVSYGREVVVIDPKGTKETIKTKNDIPYGHKIAIKEIKKAEHITKYGEDIGTATNNIKIGEHVHVHNLDSLRGRGDLNKEGENR